MSPDLSKQQLFEQTQQQLHTQGFGIMQRDQTRPWGGFFVLSEDQAQQFADTYFGGLPVEQLRISGKLSPKILLVAPHQRLSWQYHHRRAEIWKVVRGTVGIITSATDEEGPLQTHGPGQTIMLRQGERHRLVGLDDWGMIAEIWQHTDAQQPSDENDIVRVQDDFGR
ncbi:cupin domain-containing protein [Hymenobacter chitinivorans]|uniref:Mannose-6-phosphate isomerase-like protein (Cupin superfamily) n=1 Tax=Hymenobacter chitinivorans DSM 11115 TaxID=1121954 RepID=A0A2M9B9J6_9BACT|nr:phosphoheptose isomerase [Hymenobacter chitinivorans]PJJ54596.1 mannose-6-phosphate isomerase-like protein (cupin superfamily) [Hymenobacter chitinivorans DSM 11115]